MILKTDLLPHQAAAADKLTPIKIGALFMEMGTGKSRTAIEIIHRRERKIWNVAWFCPVSLKHTVRYEIRKHTDTPDEEICVWDDKINQHTAQECFWHIIGIESMSASRRVILTAWQVIGEFSMVIVDESGYIKGHRAARTSWITNISRRARYRMILTGTPISQGVVDLFSQMRFLNPRILGYNSFYSFAHNHLEYSEKYPGMIVRAHNTEWIAAKIAPYVYQVTKDECLDLPDKLHETRYCNLTQEQAEHYDQAKEKFLLEIDEFDSITIFRLFTALQQIASGFWNRRREDDTLQFLEFRQFRTDKLLEVIREIPEREKVIIWAKFVYDLNNIRTALQEEYGPGSTALFYGELNEKRRNAEVERFRNGARFFIATQSCGGHGLTLNEATYTIFYNNGFKYAERRQAEDRNHRIGQGRPVTYIDIVCDCGIDDRIMAALWKKANVVECFKEEVDKVKGKKSKIEALIKSL